MIILSIANELSPNYCRNHKTRGHQHTLWIAKDTVNILCSWVEVHTQVKSGDVLCHYPIIVDIHAAVVICSRVNIIPRPLGCV